MAEEIIMDADATLEAIIKEFRKLKDAKDALNKQLKELNPQIDYVQGLIIEKMQAEGATKISTDYGSASLSTKDYAQIKDFEEFIHYVLTHDAFHLLQKRVNDAPCRLIWDDEEAEEIPGIGKFEKTTLNFRKK